MSQSTIKQSVNDCQQLSKTILLLQNGSNNSYQLGIYIFIHELKDPFPSHEQFFRKYFNLFMFLNFSVSRRSLIIWNIIFKMKTKPVSKKYRHYRLPHCKYISTAKWQRNEINSCKTVKMHEPNILGKLWKFAVMKFTQGEDPL